MNDTILSQLGVLQLADAAASDGVETRREVVEVSVRDTADGKLPAHKSSEPERGEGANFSVAVVRYVVYSLAWP